MYVRIHNIINNKIIIKYMQFNEKKGSGQGYPVQRFDLQSHKNSKAA